MKQMKNRNTMLLCVPEIKYAYGLNECQTSTWQLTRVSVCLSCLSHVEHRMMKTLPAAVYCNL